METRRQMFEFIDQLASRTGQKDLCEAVKALYKVCFESTADDIDNYNSIVRTLSQEGANITDAASFANALSEHGINSTVENDTVTVQRPDGTFDDYKLWGQFTNGTPLWVKRWSDDYDKMNYLDPSLLLVDVFTFAHKLPDV
jgi:hypothetical protein